MMRRSTFCVWSLSLLLGAGACTAEGSTKQKDDEATACKELLGTSGVDWVKSNTEAETGVSSTSDDLESAKSLFREQAKNWVPSSTKVPLFTNSELCRVVQKSDPSTASLSIRYGASVTPFDHPFDKKSTTVPDQTVTPVNADVKLVYGKDSREKQRYYVYVRCQVPGAPAGQANEVPLEGVMTDTLTKSDSVDDHLNYLLHSTRMVLKEFECQNNPHVPESAPAHTK
ncbi:hypothetical protein SHKM778_22130 [Streptomyces sp. KM77-8]|uniref:Lipoprotein n=1 Tax=Streptomyces haneummycinicus TaxID=3074435 RepID=A0AAT9HF80_9ACTN